MKKILFAFASLLIAAGVQAQKTHPDISSLLVKATIDPSAVKGPIKPMNAVNNGPNPEDDPQQMEDFRILSIPFCRTHDSTVDDYYGYHLVDISEVFPDFGKDPDKESSYDFRETDAFIKTLLDSGAKVMYRLGQSIETHTAAKYNIYPPKDYRKWARICEHVIMHYNEGWADGFHYDIRYWEIWNEADLDQNADRWKTDPRTWAGSLEEFFKFYEVAAKHLKKRFPDLKIGGPSFCRILHDKTYLYFPEFFKYMHAHNVPIDFISWHKYDVEPSLYVKEAYMLREWMKEYGYEDAELFLTEWNYWQLKKRGAESSYEYYNFETRLNIKGAAFVGAVMCAMQDAPVDMLMYYDFRVNVDSFCGFYDPQTRKHMPTYYVFYAWNKLRGNQCECTLEGGEGDIYAVAAVKDGKTTLMLTRYNGDNNACNIATVNISVKGYSPGEVVYCHLTDDRHNYTEIPLFPAEDGTVRVKLCNNSIALIEFPCASQKYLSYEQFGAKGDGVTDDLPAIIATHAAANEKGLPVKAADGKTYYIGNTAGTAVIRTDVDFGTAKFIIDDSRVSLEDRENYIFRVESSLEPFTIDGIGSLKREQTNIGKSLPCRSLVEVVNDHHKVYIRLGANQNSGVSQKEFFIVDGDGNIEPSSAIIWDYDEITRMTAHPIDGKLLTIKGGIFTTIANQAPSKYTYYGRGIAVERSNVRIEGISHYIEGELDHGAPYDGFLSLDTAADIVVSDCLFTAHKTYRTIGSAGVPVSMGTYDISAHGCVGVKWENCTQTTDINDTHYWGIFVSNFCKALTLDHCILSRFDAHQGVRNVTLTGCEFGHTGVNVVGYGTLLLDGCTVRRKSLITLREDYGSSWEGEVIVRNCKLIVPERVKNVSILRGSNAGEHDFGYACYLPEIIDIENLVIDDSRVSEKDYQGPMVLGKFKRNYGKGVINIRNVEVASGKPLEISQEPKKFSDYTVTISR